MVKKLFGINSNTSSHHQNVHQPTTFMVVDDPSVLQGFYNEQQQQQNQQQLLNSTTTNNGANNVSANNNGGWNLGGLTQQQQQQLLNQFASSSISSSSSNNNNGMMNQGNYSSSLPNNMNNMNSNNNFSSFGINNGNLFITTSNNNNNMNNMNTNMNNNMNTNNMAMNNMTMNNMNNNNTNLMMTNSMNNNGNNFMMQSSSYNSNNNNSNNMFRLDDLSTNNTNTNNSIGRNNNNNISNNNNNNTFMFGQGSSSTSTSNHQQQQQQPFIVNNVNNQSVNIVLNNENAAKKYAPVIKWSLAPSTAYSFSNQSTSNMISNEADNIMSQTLIDPVFGPDDCKVSKGAQLTNTKLFCLSDQITRDFQFLRPSVQTDNLYHLTEMENESSWLPNDRIAPKKTSHNCLVNDWLVFCSQDPQLLKLVGRYINGASNTDIQLFADFVLVTSNNHDEDSRESLFGKQRFKGGIPLQMKLVRNSANNANMTPLLYFEKRINRESVNNKDAPSASGMGGKRVAQLRIYLKDSTQEICLVHSDGFWVRTKSREEIHRTSPREVQPQPQPQETVTKKKRNAFYGFFQGNGGRAVKRDQQNAIVVESPRVFMDSQGNYQQTTITEIVATQPFQQQLDLSQVSNSASSYGSNSYLSNSGGFALHGVSPISNQIQMQNGGNDELSSSLSSTPNNNSHLSVSQQNISTTDVAEILRNLSISLPNNHGGHHSRNSSFTSPNGLASSCSSTSSSSYLVPNSSNSTDIGFHSLLDPQPGEPIDNTISKLDAAIQFFSTMKDAYLKIKNNQSADMPNMGELCAQFSSSLQDKRGRDNKGFKRVRQGNESGAVSPQSNHSGKSLTVPFRTTSSSAPNTSTLNMNGSSPLVNNVISNVGYPGVAFNGNNNVMVNQGMQFNNNFITNSSSLNNLPMKNFDGDLPHTLFNSADTDANQDIFNM